MYILMSTHPPHVITSPPSPPLNHLLYLYADVFKPLPSLSCKTSAKSCWQFYTYIARAVLMTSQWWSVMRGKMQLCHSNVTHTHTRWPTHVSLSSQCMPYRTQLVFLAEGWPRCLSQCTNNDHGPTTQQWWKAFLPLRLVHSAHTLMEVYMWGPLPKSREGAGSLSHSSWVEPCLPRLQLSSR